MTARPLLRRLVVWGPLAAYLALIYFLSSRSSTPWATPYPDKLLHALEYGVLAALTARALNGTVRRPIPAGLLVFAWSLVLVYAVTDEIHQAFVPNRVSDWRDVVADALGAAVVLALLWLAGRLLFRPAAAGAGNHARAPRPLNDLARKEPT